jgi:hypothetical protein
MVRYLISMGCDNSRDNAEFCMLENAILLPILDDSR